MKISEIVQGATYESEGIKKLVREVLEIDLTGKLAWYASQKECRIVRYCDPQGRGGRCTLPAFARWAHRRVE